MLYIWKGFGGIWHIGDGSDFMTAMVIRLILLSVVIAILVIVGIVLVPFLVVQSLLGKILPGPVAVGGGVIAGVGALLIVSALGAPHQPTSALTYAPSPVNQTGTAQGTMSANVPLTVTATASPIPEPSPTLSFKLPPHSWFVSMVRSWLPTWAPGIKILSVGEADLIGYLGPGNAMVVNRACVGTTFKWSGSKGNSGVFSPYLGSDQAGNLGHNGLSIAVPNTPGGFTTNPFFSTMSACDGAINPYSVIAVVKP
jgi:hypothetical protein